MIDPSTRVGDTTMMWTVEPAAPWHVTAADPDTFQRTRSRTANGAPFRASLLDWTHADDRSAVEAALESARAGHPITCPCRTRAGGHGQLTITPVMAESGPQALIASWSSAPDPTSSSDGKSGTRGVVDDHTLREVLGIIGHDLRTPLNGVLGMSRLLLDSGLRADQIEYARAIDTSAEHLLSVIEDLLEFATLDLDTALRDRVSERAAARRGRRLAPPSGARLSRERRHHLGRHRRRRRPRVTREFARIDRIGVTRRERPRTGRERRWRWRAAALRRERE
jgi:His Kinase A (phospho-acceptor) domain